MPDEEQSGPSRATIALAITLALPVVLVLIFLVVGHVQSGQNATVPQVGGQGLRVAQVSIKAAGFEVTTHDALGRNRGQRTAKDWKVCQYRGQSGSSDEPLTGQHTRNTKIDLPVVKLNEPCPATDQGLWTPATATMPDLYGRTGYIAQRTFGDDASIQFIDVTAKKKITGDLGDVKVCYMRPPPQSGWHGVPVALAVVPFNDFEKLCPAETDAAGMQNIAATLDGVINDLKKSDD